MKVLSVLRTSSGVDEYPLLRALMGTKCELTNLDDRMYGFHCTPNRLAWVERRLNRSAYAGQFNEDLTRYLDMQRPDLLVLFKAPHVSAQTIEHAKRQGCRTLCIYPDLDPRVQGEGYVRMLQAVDEFYFTKPNLADNFRACIRRDAQLLYPLYSRLESGEIDTIDDHIGVSFVGHHSPGKERSLREFLSYYKGRLTVVGEGWKTRLSHVGEHVVVHPAIYGSAIQRIYQRSICTLGLLMEPLGKGWAGDEITSRSVLVPVNGGLLLHPRNPASLALYGKRCNLLYSSLREAADLATQLAKDHATRRLLAHEQKQQVLIHASCAEDLVANWINS